MSATSKQLITAFNEYFMDFINDIVRIFPYEEPILRAKSSIESIIKLDPKMLIIIWKYRIVAGYLEQINAGNIDFFIYKDYSEDLKTMGAGSDKVLQSINDLRSKIAAMSADNKNKTILYIQNLTKLANICQV